MNLEFAKTDVQMSSRKGFLVRAGLRPRENERERHARSGPTKTSTSRASNRLLPVLGVLSIKEYPSIEREDKAIRYSASKMTAKEHRV